MQQQYETLLHYAIAANKSITESDCLVRRGTLESAIASPFQKFAGEVLYPTVSARDARLVYAIAEAQAFLDGNKRTALLTMIAYLKIERVRVTCTNHEIAEQIHAIGSKDLTLSEFQEWLNSKLLPGE